MFCVQYIQWIALFCLLIKKTKYPKDYKERLEEGRLVGSKILK